MKGFYITVSNGLLIGGHRKKMGSAVWEFMWLLDHMTSISEEGVGLVLGGRPIKLDEMAGDEIRRDAVSLNLKKLNDGGYINIIHAPYGLIISINKAQKIFNQKKEVRGKPQTSNNTGLVKTANLSEETANLLRGNREPNSIQDSSDKTVRPKDTDVVTDVTDGKKFNDLLYKFKNVNPNYEKFFANKTERGNLQAMINKYTYEKIDNLLSRLPEIVQKPYAPRITSPTQLFNKMGDLVLFLKQERLKGGGIIDARHIK